MWQLFIGWGTGFIASSHWILADYLYKNRSQKNPLTTQWRSHEMTGHTISILEFPVQPTVINKTTLRSLINGEAIIRGKGGKSSKINKRGDPNKRGGWNICYLQKTKCNYFSLIFGVKHCSKPFLDTVLTSFNALYCKIQEKLTKSYEFLNLKPLK